MSYIGWILFSFGLLRLGVSMVNLCSPLYLKKYGKLGRKSTVSVLIPARNEEKSIRLLLEDLLSSREPADEIIVYDDLSTDGTAGIVEEVSRLHPSVKLIRGTGPEKGWLGKNYACHQLAQVARGDLFLFLDADVRTGKDLVGKSASYLERYRLSLLSIFPKQVMSSLGSRMTVPLMNWILVSLLPLILVRKSKRISFSAANGQFMLFRAPDYVTLLPHKRFRNNPVEDIAIIRFYKKQKLPVATLLGNQEIRCRMYDTAREAVIGFSKNIFQFFGGSQFLTLLFAIATTITPFYLFWFNSRNLGWLYVLIIIGIRIFTSCSSKQSWGQNVLLLLPQHLFFWVIIITGIRNRKKKRIVWKDRNIYAASSPESSSSA